MVLFWSDLGHEETISRVTYLFAGLFGEVSGVWVVWCFWGVSGVTPFCGVNCGVLVYVEGGGGLVQ